MNIQHSSGRDDWQTPDEILDAVRDVLGGIDLDPASSEEANSRVGAMQILTEADNALDCPWPMDCRVYLNPPGGKIGNKSKTKLFWRRMMEYRKDGFLLHGIFAFFSIEGLQNTQSETYSAMDFPLCIPKKRVQWVHPTEEKHQPSHSNAFIYIPGHLNDTDHFIKIFSQIGRCKS